MHPSHVRLAAHEILLMSLHGSLGLRSRVLERCHCRIACSALPNRVLQDVSPELLLKRSVPRTLQYLCTKYAKDPEIQNLRNFPGFRVMDMEYVAYFSSLCCSRIQ
jgi:hypothetical protein